MKRLVHVWMVALALVGGASSAQADTIADFHWFEDGTFFDTDLRLTNDDIVDREISQVQFFVNGSLVPEAINTDSIFLAGQAFNVNPSALPPGSVLSVAVSFMFDGLLYAGSLTRADLAILDPGVVCDPGDDLCVEIPPTAEATLAFDEQARPVPEPVTLGVMALGLTGAIVSRRRRR